MGVSLVDGDFTLTGTIRHTGTLVPSAGCVADSHVSASADIGVAKQRHRVKKLLSFTGTPTAATQVIYACRVSTATIQYIKVGQIAKNSSGSVTVDVQKSTGGGAFATILSATVTCNSSDTDRTAEAATVSSASLVSGDILEVVITVSTPNGTGLWIEIEVEEVGA